MAARLPAAVALSNSARPSPTVLAATEPGDSASSQSGGSLDIFLYAIFGLAVVNAKGEPAGRSHLLIRWAIVWLSLFLPMALVALLIHRAEGIAIISAFLLLLLWVSAAVYAVVNPHRGLHDWLAGSWVVRR